MDRRHSNPSTAETNDEPAAKRQRIEADPAFPMQQSHATRALVPERRGMGPLPPTVIKRFHCYQPVVNDAGKLQPDHPFAARSSKAFEELAKISFNERCKVTKEALIRLGLVGHAGSRPSTHSPVGFAFDVVAMLRSDPSLITTSSGAKIPWQSSLFWHVLSSMCSVNIILLSTAALPMKYRVSDQAPTIAFLHIRNFFGQISQLVALASTRTDPSYQGSVEHVEVDQRVQHPFPLAEFRETKRKNAKARYVSALTMDSATAAVEKTW